MERIQRALFDDPDISNPLIEPEGKTEVPAEFLYYWKKAHDNHTLLRLPGHLGYPKALKELAKKNDSKDGHKRFYIPIEKIVPESFTDKDKDHLRRMWPAKSDPRVLLAEAHVIPDFPRNILQGHVIPFEAMIANFFKTIDDQNKHKVMHALYVATHAMGVLPLIVKELEKQMADEVYWETLVPQTRHRLKKYISDMHLKISDAGPDTPEEMEMPPVRSSRTTKTKPKPLRENIPSQGPKGSKACRSSKKFKNSKEFKDLQAAMASTKVDETF